MTAIIVVVIVIAIVIVIVITRVIRIRIMIILVVVIIVVIIIMIPFVRSIPAKRETRIIERPSTQENSTERTGNFTMGLS